jgi:UDP-glucose 4-epimerase
MGKYVVTGGAGFIGSHLCDSLLQLQHEVIAIDNLSNSKVDNLSTGVHFIEGDIRNHDLLRTHLKNIDGCFHLAAIPSVVMTAAEWIDYHSINLDATINIFQHAILAGNIPVVYASSCAVYGNTETLPLHEDLMIKPISAYGVDKLTGEMNARVATYNYHLPTFGLRFFNVYGPKQNPNSPYSGVISRFIDGIQSEKTITIYGDGTQTRDFVYVDDIVSALVFSMKMIDSKKAEVINVCRGESIGIRQLAETIGTILKKTPQIHFEEARSYDVKDSCGSIENAVKKGIISKYSLHQGLEKMLLV